MNEKEFDKAVRKKIIPLDNQSPGLSWSQDDLLYAILAKQKSQKQILWYKISGGLAAAMMLITMGIYFKENFQSEHISIRRWEETKSPDTISFAYIKPVVDFQQVLDKRCKEETLICQTDKFKDLKKQLDELEDHSEELELQLNRFGNDPALVKARMKIHRVKKEVENELLEMIGS